MFNKKENKQIYKGNRAGSLIKFKANDMVNKLESIKFNLTGAEDILEISDFTRLRKKLGKQLSLTGQGAIGFIPFDKTFIAILLEVTDYTMIGSKVIKVIGVTGSTIIRDNNEYLVYTKYEIKNGKYVLNRYIKIEVDEELTLFDIEEEYTFDNVLPVEMFFNNDEALNDICYADLEADFERLNYFDSKLREEWEKTKTLGNFNENFTDSDPETVMSEIKNGKDYTSESSFESRLGAGQGLIPANGGTQFLQAQILFLEDDIKLKLGIKRDNLQSNNKHNLEIVMKEQFLTEELISKRLDREKHYNRLFTKLGKLINIALPIITLEFSKIEQAKLDLLESSVLEAKMKATNISSQITKGGNNE